MPISALARSPQANSNHRKRKSTPFQEIYKFLIDPSSRCSPATRLPDYSISSRDLPLHVQIFEFSLFVSVEADVRHYLSLLNNALSFGWAWLALCQLPPRMLDGPETPMMIRQAAFRSSPKFPPSMTIKIVVFKIVARRQGDPGSCGTGPASLGLDKGAESRPAFLDTESRSADNRGCVRWAGDRDIVTHGQCSSACRLGELPNRP
jgi:hypothetical protein